MLKFYLFLFYSSRYEVAHQLQQHQSAPSEETTVDQIHVSNQIQVEIEGTNLHQQTTVATQQEAILQLSPQPDMDTVSPALEQTLVEQPLHAEEGKPLTEARQLIT